MPVFSRVPRNTFFVATLGLASIATVWSSVSFYRVPLPGPQYLTGLLLLVLGIALLVCAGRALFGLRQNRGSSVVLGAAVVLSATVAYQSPKAGRWLRDRDFELLRPKMERVVEEYRASDDSAMRLDRGAVPEDLRDRIYGIWGSRTQAGRVDVWFFYGLGWPPKHFAWIYTSDSTASAESIEGWFWHGSRRLTPYWRDARD